MTDHKLEIDHKSPFKGWYGSYRDVRFEIRTWNFGIRETIPDYPLKEECWGLYLYIPLKAIPKKFKPESFWIRARELPYYRKMKGQLYDEHPILSEIAFNGGITFYSKRVAQDDSRYVVVGADYQHSWDQERTVDEALLRADAKRAIDSLYDLMPGFKA